jgi:hypothetical protein
MHEGWVAACSVARQWTLLSSINTQVKLHEAAQQPAGTCKVLAGQPCPPWRLRACSRGSRRSSRRLSGRLHGQGGRPSAAMTGHDRPGNT